MFTHSIASLVELRSELSGEINRLLIQLRQAQANVAALNDMIRQFDPDCELSSSRPGYMRKQLTAEQDSRDGVLETLRCGHEPMIVSEIAGLITKESALQQR